MKKIKSLLVAAAILCSFVAALAPVGFANASTCVNVGGDQVCVETDEPGDVSSERSAKEFLPVIAGTLATLIGVISVIMIIYAGIMYSTAAGDPGKTARAKQIIVGAVIGIIIAVVAGALALFVADQVTGA